MSLAVSCPWGVEIGLPDILPGEFLTLPDRMSVVEWAESSVELSPRYSAVSGKLNLGLTPHLREPLDCFADRETQEITMVFGSQTGKTTAMELMALYSAAKCPAPGIWVFPTDKARDTFVEERFRHTIDGSAALRGLLSDHGRAITAKKADFLSMVLYFALADSEADLAQKSCQYAFADEIGKYPDKTTREGAPLDQVKKRLRTFVNSKMVKSGTQTTPDGVVQMELERSDWRQWLVPCLGCGKAAPWEFERLKWEKRPAEVDRLEFARQLREGEAASWYECPECGHQARTSGEKSSMNGRGKWEPKNGKRGRHAGFHLSSFASWMTTFAGLAADWQEAVYWLERGDDRKTQTFIIHELARPYQGKRVVVEEAGIVERADLELKRGQVPDGALFHTLGIDVQHDRVVWVRSAWGEGQRLTVFDWGEISGRFEELHGELDAMVQQPFSWKDQDGDPREGMARLTMIDSGDGQMTGEVYRYCNRWSGMRVLPIKGESGSLPGGRYTLRSKDDSAPHKGRLHRLDTNRIKDFTSRLMSRPVEMGNSVRYCEAVRFDPDFQRQLCSEGRGPDGKWRVRPGYAANHYWDALIYAVAAALTCGLLGGNSGGKRQRRGVRHGKINGN